MGRNQILGSWKSMLYTDLRGNVQRYDRQELTFYSDGTGRMHARTLFKRNTNFTWSFDGEDFFIFDLGGPGSVAVATVQGNELGVAENGMLMVYSRS